MRPRKGVPLPCLARANAVPVPVRQQGQAVLIVVITGSATEAGLSACREAEVRIDIVLSVVQNL